MKKMMFVFVSILTAGALAQAYSLQGADASRLAEVLHQAGMTEIWDVTFAPVGAIEVSCVGENFQDTCSMKQEVYNPNQVAKSISGQAASDLWSLIKKSGIQNSAGPNGESMIKAGTIDCTLYSYQDDVCNLSGE